LIEIVHHLTSIAVVFKLKELPKGIQVPVKEILESDEALAGLDLDTVIKLVTINGAFTPMNLDRETQ
jgi:hypothetical protein